MSDTVISAYWSFKHFTSANGVNIPYQIYIPNGYTPEKKYPCILYMHSAGVKCSDGSQIKTPEAKFLRVLEEGKYAAVYIKSLIPEKMKVKLVVIDSCPAINAPRPLPSFPIENAEHIDKWRYSPEVCRKSVETVFDGTPT